MAKIQYQPPTKMWNRTRETIETADKIASEYYDDGHILSVRQMFYQFVSRNLCKNTPNEYDRIQRTIAKGRLWGMIDWLHFEDRGRNLKARSHYDSIVDILESAYHSYHKNLWVNQRVQPEIWTEKDALLGVCGDICHELDVPLLSMRGYNSYSEMWRAAQRFIEMRDNCKWQKQQQTPLIILLSDHDAAGIDMSRVVQEKLELFMGGRDFEFVRLGLTMEQVAKFGLPPNSAKVKRDSRVKAYIEEFGPHSWELDALEPSTIIDLIRDEVLKHRDEEQYAKDIAAIESDRRRLLHMIDDFGKGVL